MGISDRDRAEYARLARNERQKQRTRIKRAIEFLQKLRPGGPWVLSAIEPDGGITTKTVHTITQAELFIDQYDERRNLYYSVNPVRTEMDKKASKTDIAAIEYTLADLDPQETETSEAAKKRYLAQLNGGTFTPKPVAAVDSGNGIQLLWKMKERIALAEPTWVEETDSKGKKKKVLKFSPEDQATIDDVEARIKNIMVRLGAKPGTQNIDRILRLPGTINLPNEKKRKEGRTECPTKLLWFNGASYRLDDFPKEAAAPPKKKKESRKKRDYDDLIKNGSAKPERSEDFQAVVWHLARKGMSIDDITAELDKYPQGIGAKYAGRLRKEVKRSYEKWPGSHKSTSEVVGGQLPQVVDQAEAALLASGHELYQRGLLVRPAIVPLKASDDRDTNGWRLLPLTEPYLVDIMTRTANFVRFDKRSDDWVPINAPLQVAKTYLARAGEWKLPVLTGVVNTPFLRADGSLCQKPGYDAATGLLFKPDGQSFPKIPERPSKADAIAALALLCEPLQHFPFVTKADKAVALSGMLTGLDRCGREGVVAFLQGPNDFGNEGITALAVHQLKLIAKLIHEANQNRISLKGTSKNSSRQVPTNLTR